MSSSQTDKRIDPLIDAYRQASELDAQTSATRPSATVRAAVLAHARVVAQSAADAEPNPALSEAVRARPAANEPKPIWRMVAGVMLGLAGMWAYQLTRPGTTGEANVAVVTAPQGAKSAKGAEAADAEKPAAATAAVAAPKPAATRPETSVAVTGAGGAITGAGGAITGAGGAITGAGGAARDAMADSARSETSVALAKRAEPPKKTESSAQVAAAPVLATPIASATATAAAVAPAKATGAATSAIPEAATSEPQDEIAVAVAVADTRKLARTTDSRATAASPAATTAPPPNAFPTTSAGAMAQSVPQAAVSAALRPPASAANGNLAMRQGVAGAGATPEAAMFSAVRLGNIDALRAAIARGANVNARDEAARSALQIARERNHAEMVKALELAGAK